MKIWNSTGPNTEPCGIPAVHSKNDDLQSLVLTWQIDFNYPLNKTPEINTINVAVMF